jgi:hypothetical protein
VPLATALCKTFLLGMLKIVEQAQTQLRVVVPTEEEEEEEVSFQQCPIPILIHILFLSEGQTGAAWEPSKIKALSEIGGHRLEK